MRTVGAKDAEFNFGQLNRRGPRRSRYLVKYGRPVVAVLTVEEYEQ